MKKTLLPIIVLFLVIVPILLHAQIDLNVEDYPTLGGITPDSGTDIAKFIAWIYYLGIALGAFLAVAMIAFGGFKYIMSFGNPSTAEDGKDRIKMAIFGFLLLLLAVIALRTINPAILDTFEAGLQPKVVDVTPPIPTPSPRSSQNACISSVDPFPLIYCKSDCDQTACASDGGNCGARADCP